MRFIHRYWLPFLPVQYPFQPLFYILFTDGIHQAGGTPALPGYPALFRYRNRLSRPVCPLIQQKQYAGTGYLPCRMRPFAYDVFKPLLFILG
jgi:hypothetical protein